MLEMMHRILEDALARLHGQLTAYLPPLLAALTLMLGAYLLATAVRWVIYRIFKGLTIDRFLRQSGVAFLVDPSGRLRATRIVAEAAYSSLLLGGLLLGVNVFGTTLTNQIVEGLLFLLPKLLVAAGILLGGMWLGHYLGRSALVWAVNENLPSARRIGTAVRVLIVFVAVVVAADQLNFARTVFLAAFLILMGGAVLTLSLAVGLGRGGMVNWLEQGRPGKEEAERSLWSHL